jgi:phenylalanyl-tRNA synthetase alpha chain
MALQESDLISLEAEVRAAVSAVKERSDLEKLRTNYLSKEGRLRTLFAELKSLSAEEKPKIAAKLNDLKNTLEETLRTREQQFTEAETNKRLDAEFLDPSLPGNFPGFGSAHPITIVERRMTEVLRPFGFRVVSGPEMEQEYYCFDALNIPKHHPARDMQDTFFAENGLIMRTHTTSVQARELQRGELPLKVIAYGRVYRNETEDPSHTSMFHQYELVWAEEGLTLAHLMGLVSHILKSLYGKRRKVRFVQKFYPYTEPSVGAQVDCIICHGQGCSSCSHSGWVTIGGSGMIHRKVFEEFKMDPNKISGFAFGLGTSRLAGQFFSLPTLKAIYEADLRHYKSL